MNKKLPIISKNEWEIFVKESIDETEYNKLKENLISIHFRSNPIELINAV